RAGLIVASVIPLAMLFAICMMNLFGVSGNLMSLGAIDFGLIVDGAVIVVEATMHHLGMSAVARKLDQEEMNEEVYQSASKMMRSAAFGQVIILIVYLPILSLTGIEGKMFRPMAQTVGFAIVGALILSVTYVPMISSVLLSKKAGPTRTVSDRIIAAIHNVYTPVIQFALRRRIIVVGSAFTALVISVILFLTLGGEFIPQLDEGDFAIETRILTGSSLSKSTDVSQKSARLLLDHFPEVERVVSKIGTSEIPIDPMPTEVIDLIVVLKERSEWTSASTRDELAQKMSSRLKEAMPGVSYGFQQPIQMRFNELMTGARQDLVLKVYGEDLDQLEQYGQQIGQIAERIDGAEDIYVEPINGLPQIVVKLNRQRLAQFGLSVEEVNRVLRTGFSGESAGQVFEDEKRFDLVVRLNQSSRASTDDIQRLYVTTSAGRQIPIEEVADVQIKVGPNQIQRDDTKRRIVIGLNVRGRDVESIVNELKQKIGTKVKFEPGYRITYGGSFENLEEAKHRLSIAVPVALALIFVLLYFTFHSLRHGLLIFTAIPLSAIGGIFALWLRDMPFSISAGIGFIALFGVAVLNGIVLIAEFDRLKKTGITDLKQIVLRGTELRLRPVIMTATVASLGFLPMALSLSSGAEVQRPLATVVIGGLATATLLTLIVLPVLYTYFEKQDVQA
ncbi:MAG: CusA/CzcA family heavy metal efflux RND transporter, partial [Cytophaga sp.]|nr:CusA/CzcA family heavy metal efflux RND transporter [Cytophaga sp.]